LLLLEKGGETVYFGEIGQDSGVIREYFGRHGAHCPSNVNPAEYMLEAIGAGVTPRVGNQDWKDTWLESSEFVKMKEEIASIKKTALLEEEPDQKLMFTCEQVLVDGCHTWAILTCQRCHFLLLSAQDCGSTE
jgi:hypothetical protein